MNVNNITEWVLYEESAMCWTRNHTNEVSPRFLLENQNNILTPVPSGNGKHPVFLFKIKI